MLRCYELSTSILKLHRSLHLVVMTGDERTNWCNFTRCLEVTGPSLPCKEIDLQIALSSVLGKLVFLGQDSPPKSISCELTTCANN